MQRTIELEDPLIVRAVRSLLRAQTPLPRLLVYRSAEASVIRRSAGGRHELIEKATCQLIHRVEKGR